MRDEPTNGRFVPIPVPDAATVYAQAPPLTAELEWLHNRLVEGIQAPESRPENRLDLLRWAALVDRSFAVAFEKYEAYGSGPNPSPARIAAWDEAESLQWYAIHAHRVLEAHDEAHGTRLGPHAGEEYGLHQYGARGYIRQEYLAARPGSQGV